MQVIPVSYTHLDVYKRQVVDRSASGGTLFVEPAAAGKLRDEMEQLTIDERNEVQRILYTLTDLVAVSYTHLSGARRP